MKYLQLEQFVSKPRLDRFLTACGNSKTKAQKLYKINLRVSQEAYPLLNLFEIFLRNAVNTQMAVQFADADWIVNQKAHFMSDPSLTRSRFQMRQSVQNAETAIRRKGAAVTSGKVIAEQTFGFWTSLFETHHFRLIGGAPLVCFAHKPAAENRSSIAAKLNDIRQFRNRVYHNEPICFLNHNIDFTEVQNVIQTIYDLLNWIDHDLRDYVAYFDNIQAKIDAGNSL